RSVAATLVGAEAKRHHGLLGGRRREARDAGEPSSPAPGLPAVLPGDVTADVLLFGGDHALLLLEGALLRAPALGALCDECRVPAGIRRRGPGPLGQDVVYGAHEADA